MSSWQAHATDMYARFWLKRRLAGKKDLARARAILSGGALPIPPGAAFRRAAVSSVSGEWVTPAGSATGPVLLYLHGGGYFTGCARAHRPITASFATAGFNVFVPEYRLAPEYPYPAAVDDVEGVWNGLLESGHPASSITISGDSAGGGLALALMLRLREKRKPLPAAAALFSPWTDLAGTGESLLTNARRDAVFGAREIRIAADWYLNGAEPQTPEASPLYAPLDGLPPLFIEVGERESLLNDSTRLAARAQARGVNAILKRLAGRSSCLAAGLRLRTRGPTLAGAGCSVSTPNRKDESAVPLIPRISAEFANRANTTKLDVYRQSIKTRTASRLRCKQNVATAR